MVANYGTIVEQNYEHQFFLNSLIVTNDEKFFQQQIISYDRLEYTFESGSLLYIVLCRLMLILPICVPNVGQATSET
jgi:hypothetical protein